MTGCDVNPEQTNKLDTTVKFDAHLSLALNSLARLCLVLQYEAIFRCRFLRIK